MKEKYPNAQLKLHRELQDNRTCPGVLFTRDYLEGILQKDEADDEKQKEIQRLMGIIAQLRIAIMKLLNEKR